MLLFIAIGGICMEQNNYCDNCKVNVSSDLSNCPLCGKHVIKNGEQIVTNKNSYPIYNLKFVSTARWYNIIRVFFWIFGVVSVVTNLVFKTEPYWFPYVLGALLMIFNVFIAPIKKTVASYIKNLILMSVLLAIFIIFIDVYNYYTLNKTFGWAIAYVAPLIMTTGVIATAFICLFSRIYESQLLRSVTFIGIFSVAYFLIKLFFFTELATWPSLVFMCVAVGLVFVLEVFKRNKLIKELAKEFHL